MQKLLKRMMDIIVSALFLILLLPLLGIIGLGVWQQLGRPIFFKQKRVGLNEKIFYLYKFRTMLPELSETGKVLPKEKRLKKFGRFLRSTSLDELPELWNILKGDMSLVGPRPLLVEYLPLYSQRQRRRHEMRPGLTGLAQIKGRNYLNWSQKFEYDVTYIENFSLTQDVIILAKTMGCVLKREGIDTREGTLQKRFTGNAEEE